MEKKILSTLRAGPESGDRSESGGVPDQGGHISGQSMSRRLGVSRTAVWKAIEALRQKGFVIESTIGRGYRLSGGPDRIIGLDIEVGDCSRIWFSGAAPWPRLRRPMKHQPIPALAEPGQIGPGTSASGDDDDIDPSLDMSGQGLDDLGLRLFTLHLRAA